jgi:hypothetical protein
MISHSSFSSDFRDIYKYTIEPSMAAPRKSGIAVSETPLYFVSTIFQSSVIFK